jgi:hypothetical protein
MRVHTRAFRLYDPRFLILGSLEASTRRFWLPERRWLAHWTEHTVLVHCLVVLVDDGSFDPRVILHVTLEVEANRRVFIRFVAKRICKATYEIDA